MHALIAKMDTPHSITCIMSFLVNFLVHKDSGALFSQQNIIQVFTKMLVHELNPVKTVTLKCCANMFKSEKGKKAALINR